MVASIHFSEVIGIILSARLPAARQRQCQEKVQA
jgi:hypothetical protein